MREEEWDGLRAIYGSGFRLSDDGGSCALSLRSCTATFALPADYPERGVPRVTVMSAHLTREQQDAVAAAVAREFRDWEGGAVLFAMAEAANAAVEELVVELAPQRKQETASNAANVHDFDDVEIVASDVTKVRKSKFVAWAGRCTDHAEAMRFVAAVKHRDRRVADATHNIVAYRLMDGTSFRDDDGEGGAGDKLLFVLDAMRCQNVVVVVTRWFGGVLLGPERYKLITNVASEALQRQARKKT